MGIYTHPLVKIFLGTIKKTPHFGPFWPNFSRFLAIFDFRRLLGEFLIYSHKNWHVEYLGGGESKNDGPENRK